MTAIAFMFAVHVHVSLVNSTPTLLSSLPRIPRTDHKHGVLNFADCHGSCTSSRGLLDWETDFLKAAPNVKRNGLDRVGVQGNAQQRTKY